MLETLSALALWPGLYVAGATVFLGELALARPLGRWAVLSVFLTGVGVYLLDRVKLRDAWLDPADADAHPDRHAIITASPGVVRWFAGGVLIAAAVIGLVLGPPATGWLLAGLPIGAGAGVVLYAARPRGERARIKDRLVIKNVYSAFGVAMIAVAACVLWRPGDVRAEDGAWRVLPWVIASGLVLWRVLVDAVLCDVEDRRSDGSHRTDTLAWRLGARRTRDLCFAAHLVLAAGVWWSPVGSVPVRGVWAGTTVVTAFVLRAWRGDRLRDPVDAAFAVQGVVAGMVLAWLSG